MQFLVTGHLDEGLSELGAVLEQVGMTLPATPRRAIVSLIFSRIRLRLRGLHFRPRDARLVSADELARLEVTWTAASGLGIIDPIRAAAFQTRNLLRALHVGEPFWICRCLSLETCYVSVGGGRSKRRVAGLIRMIEAIAAKLDTPYLRVASPIAQGVAAYMSGE
jgi:hypothetical protein